jgi:hypothetical protein
MEKFDQKKFEQKKFQKQISEKISFFLAVMVPRPIWSMPAKLLYRFE